MHLPTRVPPPELNPAGSAHYETNKSNTHKYKPYNRCIGKYPKLSPNAQQGKYPSNGIAEPCPTHNAASSSAAARVLHWTSAHLKPQLV